MKATNDPKWLHYQHQQLIDYSDSLSFASSASFAAFIASIAFVIVGYWKDCFDSASFSSSFTAQWLVAIIATSSLGWELLVPGPSSIMALLARLARTKAELSKAMAIFKGLGFDVKILGFITNG